MKPEEFQKKTGASTEAMARLKTYESILKEWNQKINLVAGSTLGDIWQRHFLDSAQLAPLIGQGQSVIDIGSGAGFPGLVLAAMGAENIILCERDVRKAAFLRTAAAAMKLKVEVINLPIEGIEGRRFDVVTSRALADLSLLLSLSAKLRKASTTCLFLKGKNLDAEMAAAQKEWGFDADRLPSVSDSEGVILRLSKIASKKRMISLAF